MSGTIAARIAALNDLTVAELRAKYRELFGEETRSGHRSYLFKKIAWRMQALELGAAAPASRTCARWPSLGFRSDRARSGRRRCASRRLGPRSASTRFCSRIRIVEPGTDGRRTRRAPFFWNFFGPGASRADPVLFAVSATFRPAARRAKSGRLPASLPDGVSMSVQSVGSTGPLIA